MLEAPPNELSALLVASSLMSLLAMIVLCPLIILVQFSELLIMIRTPMGTYSIDDYIEWGAVSFILVLFMFISYVIRSKVKNQAKRIKQAADHAYNKKETPFSEEEFIHILADLLFSLFFFFIALLLSIFLQNFDLTVPVFLSLFSGLFFQILGQRKAKKKLSQGEQE